MYQIQIDVFTIKTRSHNDAKVIIILNEDYPLRFFNDY